jgi:hypothetical protein
MTEVVGLSPLHPVSASKPPINNSGTASSFRTKLPKENRRCVICFTNAFDALS